MRMKIRRKNVYRATQVPSSINLKLTVQKPKELITIINVYAPQSGRLTESLEELDELYHEPNVALNEIIGMVFIYGDFNAKIGKRQEGEECMGRYTRGRRNTSGQTLVDFCEANCKLTHARNAVN